MTQGRQCKRGMVRMREREKLSEETDGPVVLRTLNY